MSRNNISKNDIVHNIKNRYRLPANFIECIYDNIFLIIKNGLKKDGRFKISKFGTFKVLFKKERIGFNPKSKVKHPISQRKVIVFSPSKIVKNKLNGK
tara:strand:- start:533 stop:826 length:294 start_codon:yes stop_codon:yes gene_type:complete